MSLEGAEDVFDFYANVRKEEQRKKEEELRAMEEDLKILKEKLASAEVKLSREKQCQREKLYRKIKCTIASVILIVAVLCGWASIVADYGKNAGFWSLFILIWASHNFLEEREDN